MGLLLARTIRSLKGSFGCALPLDEACTALVAEQCIHPFDTSSPRVALCRVPAEAFDLVASFCAAHVPDLPPHHLQALLVSPPSSAGKACSTRRLFISFLTPNIDPAAITR